MQCRAHAMSLWFAGASQFLSGAPARNADLRSAVSQTSTSATLADCRNGPVMESRGKQSLASAKRRPLLALSVSTTLINTPIHGHSWGSVFGVHASACQCVGPVRDPEPFSRVSRVHPLLNTPRDVRFTRDFSIAPSLTQGAAQKLRCATNDFPGDFPFEVF